MCSSLGILWNILWCVPKPKEDSIFWEEGTIKYRRNQIDTINVQEVKAWK